MATQPAQLQPRIFPDRDSAEQIARESVRLVHARRVELAGNALLFTDEVPIPYADQPRRLVFRDADGTGAASTAPNGGGELPAATVNRPGGNVSPTLAQRAALCGGQGLGGLERGIRDQINVRCGQFVDHLPVRRAS
jgi:hypothetical protein